MAESDRQPQTNRNVKEMGSAVKLRTPVYAQEAKIQHFSQMTVGFCLHMQKGDIKMTRKREREFVRRGWCAQKQITRSSVCCNEGNSVKTTCESQQAKQRPREKRRATLPACVCLLRAEMQSKWGMHVCQTHIHRQLNSQQRFQSASSAMRWIKANVSGPTPWLNANSIQTTQTFSANKELNSVTGDLFTQPSDS